MKILRLSLAAAMVATLLTSPFAWACSCAWEPGVTPVHDVVDEYLGWEVSFVGLAVAREDRLEERLTRWTVDVDVVVTGTPTDPQDVYTRYAPPGYIDSCAVSLEMGRRYRIGADRQADGKILLHLCNSSADPIPPLP